MTSRLAILRSRLARLRRARAGLRAIAAWSALASSIVMALAGVFVLDFIFALAIPQRVVVLLLAVAAVIWAFWRFTRPFLGRHETEIDMALLVERQQQIDSDLVAALQFESAAAKRWGSPELTGAVVEYVSAAAPTINVFGGPAQQQVFNRAGLLAACLALALLVAVLAPGHLFAFFNRICLGSMHYPTRTRIDEIIVDRTSVFSGEKQGNAPADCKAAQGRPLAFLVKCSGQLPVSGNIVLTSASGVRSRTRLELRALPLNDRLLRLREARAKLNDSIQAPARAIVPTWRNEILSLTRLDAPNAVAPLLSAKDSRDLPAVLAAVAQAIDHWPGDQRYTAILSGELGRLNEDLTFKVAAGDAWTDSALISMIPLPIVELKITPVPPKYAASRAEKTDASGRQFAVLEGSSIGMEMVCTNRKSLRSAWLTLQRAGGVQRVELVPRNDDRFVWSSQSDDSPLRNIRHELRYEIQVVDSDGLSLETPIRGTIRIRPDQPPTGLVEVIHKVVLPTAEPVVAYRASDDYGISRLAFLVDVERGGAKSAAPAGSDESRDANLNIVPPDAASAVESHRFELLALQQPLAGDRLPIAGSHALSLSPLNLAKGDRIKLTLESTDYRGENDEGRPLGQATLSDSLVLEISDEAGVLAAISQPDQRSAEQLTEIIKRQLGIGENPQ